MTLGRRWLLAALLTLLLAPAPADARPREASTPPPESRSTTAQPVAPGSPAATVPQTPEPPEPPDTGDDDHSRVGVNEDVTVPAGETFNGDVVCIHGHATIEGHVNGNVAVVLGQLDVSGEVDGSVTTVLTETRLKPGARIAGELVNIGGSLDQHGATIRRQVVNVPLGADFGNFWHWNSIGAGLHSFVFWSKLFFLFLFFVCALLMAALVPHHIRRISEETPAKLLVALFCGLLGYVALGITQIFLCVTIIGIPVALIVYVTFVVLKWMSMAGVFHHVGTKIGRGFGREMSLLGAIVLGFLPFAALRMLPWCIGYFIWFAVEILAFGLLIAIYLPHFFRRSAAPAGGPPAPRPIPPSPAPPEAPVTG